MKRKFNLQGKEGSILLEALLSVIILSVSLTLIIQSMITSMRVKSYVQQYFESILLADNKMVEVFSFGDNLDSMRSEGSFETPFDGYEYSMKVEGVSSDNSNLKEVRVEVSRESRKRNNNLPIISYVYDNSDEET